MVFFLLAGFCLAVLPVGAQEAPPAAPARSTVYFARDEEAINRYEANPAVVRRMMDELVKSVTGKSDTESAWRQLAGPGDRVGIKISATGGRYFAVHKCLVDAIASGLARAGVPASNIIVWDRADMRAAGYTDSASGYRVRSIESVSDYDPAAVISSPLLGKLIWGDVKFSKTGADGSGKLVHDLDQTSSESHLSKIMSREVTKVINVAVMRGSENCGIAGCLFNATIPNLDNWRRFVAGPGVGGTFIAELYSEPRISQKIVLNVMDALLAQYAGGQGFEPNYSFQFNTLYAGKDPVAVDATALREIEKWRKDAKLPGASKFAAYLEAAEAMGLGNSSADRIELKPAGPSR